MREGLIVDSVDEFGYDETLGLTRDELAKTAQFTVPVVVQRNRILRTRALFSTWDCTFTVDVDPDQVDKEQLKNWLKIAGQRIGIGDWRPQKSGHYGRFTTDSVKVRRG